MIHFILVFSRQGRVRLERWFNPGTLKDRTSKKRDVVVAVQKRSNDSKQCSSFVEWNGLRLVYRRYASLFFCFAIDQEDNELLCLEHIHRFVQMLDRYFGQVCELDLIFNLDRAFSILDELFTAGEMAEPSRLEVLHDMRKLDEKLANEEDKWSAAARL